eukprot:m.104552 g.104552  ORF g.104552 m.104552 type:complete len:61 (+) comp12640_c0_seq3:1-183(+)
MCVCVYVHQFLIPLTVSDFAVLRKHPMLCFAEAVASKYSRLSQHNMVFAVGMRQKQMTYA